ncbi:unnamed protein product [Prunus armeniaca]|uniref:Uncharacterized protein n=1 Tax=Prunus armeniaca TaxID=36596 RepID=A0A6J5UC75_PRUAR|nr:unnamed protein product [Prunus armeniaca]
MICGWKQIGLVELSVDLWWRVWLGAKGAGGVGLFTKLWGVRSDLDMEEDKSRWRYVEEMVATGWGWQLAMGKGWVGLWWE